MAGTAITLSVLDDLLEVFPLRQRMTQYASVSKPTLDQTVPVDISDTSTTFEAKVLFNGDTNYVPLTVTPDRTHMTISISMPQSVVKNYGGRTGRYYVRMTKSGFSQRLWSDTFTVKQATVA